MSLLFNAVLHTQQQQMLAAQQLMWQQVYQQQQQELLLQQQQQQQHKPLRQQPRQQHANLGNNSVSSSSLDTAYMHQLQMYAQLIGALGVAPDGTFLTGGPVLALVAPSPVVPLMTRLPHIHLYASRSSWDCQWPSKC
jgi:uncharacterized protein YlxW (UPF0749 family)